MEQGMPQVVFGRAVAPVGWEQVRVIVSLY
jgi:hypothetical protein